MLFAALDRPVDEMRGVLSTLREEVHAGGVAVLGIDPEKGWSWFKEFLHTCRTICRLTQRCILRMHPTL